MMRKVVEIVARRCVGMRVTEEPSQRKSLEETLGNAVIARALAVLEDVARVARHRNDTKMETVAMSEEASMFVPSGVDIRAIMAETRRREAEERKETQQQALETQRSTSASTDTTVDEERRKREEAIAIAARKEEAAKKRADGEKQAQISKTNQAALQALGGGRRPIQLPLTSGFSQSSSSTPSATTIMTMMQTQPGARVISLRDFQMCHRKVGTHVLQKIAIKRNRKPNHRFQLPLSQPQPSQLAVPRITQGVPFKI